MNGPLIATTKTMQDAADAAYARMIWWEGIKQLGVTQADMAVEWFKERCERGFFDIKRPSTPPPEWVDKLISPPADEFPAFNIPAQERTTS